MTGNFAIKKSVLKDIGSMNPNLIYGEDTELKIRLKIKGYDIYFKQITVLHYHADTLLKVFKKIYGKGKWVGKIRKKYGGRKDIFETEPLITHLHYIKGVISELLTLNKDFWYDSVLGFAWRLGLVVGGLKE